MLKVANSVISASRITGVLPVANGGTGVTTSTGTGNTVLSASPTLSGDVTLSTGNLVIGTAGKGIDFSVTSSGSGTMTSELLADYEEGTWTATLTGTTTAPTIPVTTTAIYTKIGRQVTIELSFLNVTTTGASGNLQVSGLPFAAGSANGLGVCAVNVNIPAAFPAFQLGAGSTTMSMIQISSSGNIAIPSTTGVYIFSTLTYSV
jgi:hypothetical protein